MTSFLASTPESYVELEEQAGRSRIRGSTQTPADALSVVEFWQDAGPNKWFAKDPEFDRQFRDRFLWHYQDASDGFLST